MDGAPKPQSGTGLLAGIVLFLAMPLMAVGNPLPAFPQANVEEKLQQLENEESKLAPAEAARRYEELLREFEARKQPVEMSRTMLGLSRAALRQQDSARAEQLARSALDLASGRHARWEAMAHFELANALVARSQPEDARAHYQAALPGFRETGDSFQEGRTLNGIGNVYYLTGFREKAWENYRLSYAIATETKNDVLLSRSLNNLGAVATATGRYAEAIELHQRSLELKLRTKDDVGAARAYSGLGTVYARLGNYDKALEYSQLALAIFRSKAPGEAAIVLNNIGGTILKNLERYPEALKYLQEAYEIASAGNNLFEMMLPLNNQGYVYSLQGRYEESLKRHGEALALARKIPAPEYELHALHGLGNNFFRMNRFREALDSFREVVALSERLKSTDEAVGGHNAMGRTFEKLGQEEAALGEYRAAVGIIESARAQVYLDVEKADYLENNLEAYTDIVRLLARAGVSTVAPETLAETFLYAEKGKARALLELLAESRQRVAPKLDPALADEQERLSAQITSVQGQIRQLSADRKTPAEKLQALWQESDRLYDAYTMLRRKVHVQDPNYSLLESPEPVALDALQRLLPEDAILLEYAFDHRRNLMGLPREPWGLCFAITREGRRVFPIEGVPQIPGWVTQLRNILVRPPFDPRSLAAPAAFRESARELYRVLVAPAEPLLAGKRRLVIVPDRFLTLVPFEVLLTASTSTGTSWPMLPYLIRRYSVTYAPSSTIYAQVVQTAPAAPAANHKDLLVVADPVYEGEAVKSEPVLEMLTEQVTRAGFERLRYSAQEASAIGSLFAPSRRDLLLREQASEDHFRQLVAANTYTYLVFSVHGIASERYPAFSSLVLGRAPASSNDGLLQVHEIYNLRLPSEVVVLSACETALGKDVQGEGLVGLTRAFLYAGARAVVASFWRVSDRSTSDLMTAFFQQRHVRRAGNAVALQRAKLEMLKRPAYSHPFYWAPFIVVGNP